jgi:DnaJ-class molecular chaperone
MRYLAHTEDGYWFFYGLPDEPCFECCGRGWVEERFVIYSKGDFKRSACPRCHGTGKES